jgi:hypothetical protein
MYNMSDLIFITNEEAVKILMNGREVIVDCGGQKTYIWNRTNGLLLVFSPATPEFPKTWRKTNLGIGYI